MENVPDKKLSLFELLRQLDDVMAMADKELTDTGMISSASEEQISFLMLCGEEKITNTVMYVRHLENNEKLIDDEISRLEALKKSNKSKIKRIKDYALCAMNKFGSSELIGTFDHKFSIRESDEVEVIDINLVPGKFVTTKLVSTVDKMAIKKAIKTMENVPGVNLKINKNVQIK